MRNEPVGNDNSSAILAVDDDPAVLELVRVILSSAGYEVLIANNARTAMDVFQHSEQRFGLLLTDVVMPDLTGPVLATRLQARQPDLKVLFMSGYHDTELVQRFASLKGYAMLPKPFSTDGLLRAVKVSLARQPAS